LATATAGDEIWVKAGTYRASCQSCSFVLAPGAKLYGGFKGTEQSLEERELGSYPSILSGDVLANDDLGPLYTKDNATHVVTVEAAVNGTIVDGFSIRDSFAYADDDPDGYFGGGILCLGGSPAIRNCNFVDDDSLAAGSGIACLDCNGVLIDTCQFSACLSDAAFVESGSATIMHCDFADNVGRGLICSAQATVSVRSCRFIGNVEGGVWNTGEVSGEYVACLFAQNVAAGSSNIGGGMLNSDDPFAGVAGSSPVISDCLFVGNISTGAGGAIYNVKSHPVILGTTIVGNQAAFGGGGMGSIEGAIPIVRNCIFWGNTVAGMGGEQSQIYNFKAAVNIAYSCVEGWSGALLGVNCIGLDPEFSDFNGPDGLLGTLDDDPHLAADSPCVDSGDPQPRADDSGIDMYGQPRSLDGNLDGVMRVDMGCAEFANVYLAVTTKTTPAGATYVSVGVSGPSLLEGFLFVGRQSGLASAPPFGTLLFDPAAGWIRSDLGPLPISFVANVTPLVGLADALTVQALGVDSATGAGNLSNAVTITMEP